MTILGPLAVLALVLGGLVYIIGGEELGRRLLFAGLVLAFASPILAAALGSLAPLVEPVVSILAPLAIAAIIGIGLVGYLRHRTHAAASRYEQPRHETSLKRRVERDL